MPLQPLARVAHQLDRRLPQVLREQAAWLRHFFIVVLATMLSACGGGGGSADSSPDAQATPGVAARIVIAPSAVLLTQVGQQKALSATVLDAQGKDITASAGAMSWESNHPEHITVSSAGLLQASSTGGSAQITVRVGELRSAPLLVVHTLLPVGAVALSDAQILGEPEEVTPGAAPSIHNQVRVRLSGVAAPLVGELLINTESKPVAGRVVSVESVGGVHQVTLGFASLREVFPHLRLNEVIRLDPAQAIIPAAVLAQFEVERTGSVFTFTPKKLGQALPLVRAQEATLVQAAQLGAQSQARGTKVQAQGGTSATPLGECKTAIDGASGAGSLPISIFPTNPFKVEVNPTLQPMATPENGFEGMVLHTEPSISAGLEFKTLVAFEGKVTCELELFAIPIPVTGVLAKFVGGFVPVGVGAELSFGKVTVVDMAVGARVSVKTTQDVSVLCPPGQSCSVQTDSGPVQTSITPTLNAPNLQSDFRIEPSLTVYGWAKASFGSLVFNSLRLDALAIKVGPSLKANFAPKVTQMADTAYKSDYQLAAIIKAGADTQLQGFLNLLGAAGVAETALLDKSFPLATSPTGLVSADVASFVTGDTVHFKVKLDDATREFLGISNAIKVLLARNDFRHAVVASAAVPPSMNEVNIAFTAPDAGSTSEFFAFVVTSILPADELALELGQAKVVASEKIVFTASTSDTNTMGPYTMSLEGEDLTKIPVRLTALGLSPDGKQVAYSVSGPGASSQIFVRNTDGSGTPVQLTFSGGQNFSPAWSPDGRQIAFGSTRIRPAQIYVMDVNGGNVRQLSNTTDVIEGLTNNMIGTDPCWSPDSKQIVYSVSRENDVVTPDGGTVLALRGGYLAVLSLADGRLTRLTKPVLLSSTPSFLTSSSDSRPMWSPDGKRIAFESTRSGTIDNRVLLTDIYVMNADGGGMVKLSSNTQQEPAFNNPSWSPDSKMLVASNWFDIFILDATSGAAKRLQRGPFAPKDYLLDPIWIK